MTSETVEKMERLPLFQSTDEFEVDKVAKISTCRACQKVLAGKIVYI